MTSEQLDPVLAAFAPSQLIPTFMLLAPYVIGVAGIILAVSLVKWGLKIARRSLSDGAASDWHYDEDKDEGIWRWRSDGTKEYK